MSQGFTSRQHAHLQYALLAGIGGQVEWENVVHRITGENQFRHLNSMVQVIETSNQTIANNTNTLLTFSGEAYDTDNLHDTVTNPSRLTAAITGKYKVVVYSNFTAANGGVRRIRITKNTAGTFSAGATFAGFVSYGATDASGAEMNASGTIHLDAGDHVECWVFHTQGGNLDINNAVIPGRFSMEYVGE